MPFPILKKSPRLRSESKFASIVKKHFLSDEEAATKVQAVFRGFKARGRAKQKLLFETWSKIDLKEESELRGDVDINTKLIQSIKNKKTKSEQEKNDQFAKSVLEKLQLIDTKRKS